MPENQHPVEGKTSWQFTILAPDTMCIVPGWSDGTTIAYAFVHTGGVFDSNVDPLSIAYSYTAERLRALLRSLHPSAHYLPFWGERPLEVSFYSSGRNIYPLFAFNNAHQLTFEPLGQLNRSCPVILLTPKLGLAAFAVDAVGDFADREWFHPLLLGLRDWSSIPELNTSYKGVGLLLSSGVVLAETSFSYELGRNDGPIKGSTRQVYQRIFASYAREDTAVVESLASIIRATGLGELLWDLKILRAGDRWATALTTEIDISDSFQLFWSVHAKASKNVKAEWKYALGLRREGFIRPVYWKEPLPRPPKELADLHFALINMGTGEKR